MSDTTPPYAYAQALDALARTVPHPTATCETCDGSDHVCGTCGHEGVDHDGFGWDDLHPDACYCKPNGVYFSCECHEYKEVPCPTCKGSGHRNYTGLQELLEQPDEVIGAAIRKMVQ